jgi:hypothetical protein
MGASRQRLRRLAHYCYGYCVGEEKAAVVVDCRFLARSLIVDNAVHVRFAGHMDERGTNAGWMHMVDLSLGYARGES